MTRHEVGGEIACRACNWFDGGRPVSQVLFSIIQDLTGLCRILKGWPSVTRHHRGVVKEADKPTSMTSKQDLFLGSLDGSSCMDVVGFFELLSRLETQLSHLNDYHGRTLTILVN